MYFPILRLLLEAQEAVAKELAEEHEDQLALTHPVCVDTIDMTQEFGSCEGDYL